MHCVDFYNRKDILMCRHYTCICYTQGTLLRLVFSPLTRYVENQFVRNEINGCARSAVMFRKLLQCETTGIWNIEQHVWKCSLLEELQLLINVKILKLAKTGLATYRLVKLVDPYASSMLVFPDRLEET